MKISKIVAFGLLLMVLVPCMNVFAMNDSSKVIVVSPTGTVNEDASADIDVHVYDKAEPASPSPISASVLLGSEISLTEKTTGVWTGKVDAKVGMIITADATVGTKDDATVFSMLVRPKATAEDAEIRLEPKSGVTFSNVGPGKKLDFTIEVKKNGVLKDDSTLEVYISGGSMVAEKLAKNKVSTGVYDTSFTVPPLKESTYYTIWAQIGTGYDLVWSNYQGFGVDFYQVWYHKTSISTTESTFDVYVADLGGKVVPSATLELNYSWRPTDGTGLQQETAGKATTDATGKTAFTITYSKVNRVVDIEGTAVANGNMQHFYGDIIITSTTNPDEYEPDQPFGYGFEVIYQENQADALKTGTTEASDFKAYYTPFLGKTGEWATKDIYYYVYTYTSILKTGKVTTNVNGSFTLQIPVPTLSNADYGSMYVAFESETSPGWYDEDMTWLYYANTSGKAYRENPELLKDTDVKVSVDKLKVGGNSTITATFAKAVNGTQAYVGVFPAISTIQDLMNWGTVQPEWEAWSGQSSGYMTKSGTTFTSTVTIPEFMPKGTYTVFVTVWDPYDYSGGYYNTYDFEHVNYITVEEGKGGSSTGGGGSKGLLGMGTVGGIDVAILMIVMIIMVVVVVGAVVMISKKKKKAGAMAAPPTTQPQPGAPPPHDMALQQAAAPPPTQEHHAHPHYEHEHDQHVHQHPHPEHAHEQHHEHPHEEYHAHHTPHSAGAAAPAAQPAPAPQPAPGRAHEPVIPSMLAATTSDEPERAQYERPSMPIPPPEPTPPPPVPAPAPEPAPAAPAPEAAKPKPNFCPTCGTKVKGQFCMECGTKLH